jgi:hypothetical protein
VIPLAAIERDALIVACAISAGIHAALTPAHFAEGTGAGLGFAAAAGKQLTGLLREHILIAADLIAAARKGNQAEVAAQQARWNANADRIAVFLSRANPRYWKPGPMKAMMRDHLRLTTNEVVARLRGNWAADVRAYDRIHRQILHMADMLSSGFVRQFPQRFR